MHVISASRRTDIPAFYAEWLMARLREGAVSVASPFGGRVTQVSLAPADVVAIMFWTKDAGPLVKYLDEITDLGHVFGFLYSVNNYPCFLEPSVPGLGHSMKIVEQLGRRWGSQALIWRYDTIVITETLSPGWHIRNFSALCSLLAPFTSCCIFSFCDYYRKTTRNMQRFVPDHVIPDVSRRQALSAEMADIARQHGIKLAVCSDQSLANGAIAKARCLDPEMLTRIVDTAERKEAVARLRPRPTRKECGCFASTDIGAYDTCAHGCVYCYANASPGLGRENREHIRVDAAGLHPRFSSPVTGSSVG